LLEKEKENLSDDGKNYLQNTYDISKRMRSLIEDLLSYSRITNATHNFEKTDLNKILDEVKNDLKKLIHEKKATIESTKLCKADILPLQFRQLMYNLINNSLKFSKPGIAPHIMIKSETVEGSKLNNVNFLPEINYCHINITDNGIGFKPKYAERIFQLFQRLHREDEYEGTGMGLAMCKRIIENHNGIITATGELNKGAQFDIYIPLITEN